MSPRLLAAAMLLTVFIGLWFSALGWMARCENRKMEQELEEWREKEWLRDLRDQRNREAREELQRRLT